MNKIRVIRFGTIAVVGLWLTSTLGVAVATTGAKVLTTASAQTAVAGRDYTTLYTFDLHAFPGARVGPMAFREDGSVVLDKVPLAGPGEFLTQSQVGIQIGKTRTWFLAQSGGATSTSLRSFLKRTVDRLARDKEH